MQGVIGATDLPVVALVTLALLGINVLVGVGVSVVHPREEGPATWALGNVLFAVGVAVLMLRVPQNEPYVALFGTAVFVLSYILVWVGFRRFRFRPIPYRAATAIFLAFFCAFTWFLLVDPNPVMRAAVTTSTIALLCGLTTWTMLYRIEPALVQTQAFIGMLAGALGMLYLLRCVAALAGVLQPSDFGGGLLGASIFILPTIASLLVAASCILMLNQRLQQRLQISAQTDPLTGLINRGLLDDLGDKEIARAKRHGYGLSVVVFEVDHFDTINSDHGYDAGDAVLRKVSELVTRNMRREDFVARLDGATISLLLPSTRLAGAQQLAERLRLEIAATAFEIGGKTFSLTASFGLAALGLHSDDWTEMMQRAQAALYRAKADGRNRIEIAAFSDSLAERPA
ncbi:MAG: GGDEF domain-containing protein [Ferrovibrio sp.]|uniref:GGDEF domain-containing protein n=1 Tax=Ferrovibrio sp. TaxID=1917215 RepID=UPI0026228A83|nr:GGDEF domain-containing protein [Ferrovibrio sp.]MCW0233257.1 GGDEF domain-containing protein [Ferrovibrio sp.]